MSNVQEALKVAEKLIVKAIMFESEAEQYLSESNYELNGCLGDSAADISVNGKAVLAKVRAALSNIEKCEPVGEVEPIGYMSNLAIQRLSQRGLGAITLHKTKTCFNPVYYTSPQPRENAPTVQREGWVSVPIEPTDEMIRKALSVEFPGTYKTHLRNPANGPKTTKDNEAQILRVTKQYTAFIQAAPKE